MNAPIARATPAHAVDEVSLPKKSTSHTKANDGCSNSSRPAMAAGIRGKEWVMSSHPAV